MKGVRYAVCNLEKKEIPSVSSKDPTPIFFRKPQVANFDISGIKRLVDEAGYAVIKIKSPQIFKDKYSAYIFFRDSAGEPYSDWLSIDTNWGLTDSTKNEIIKLIEKDGGKMHE